MTLDRTLLALMVVIIYGLFCLCFLRRRGGGDTASGFPVAATHAVTATEFTLPVLVAYASQSGNAEALARRSMQALAAHMPVRCLPLDQVDAGVLAGTRQALFVASTYGEGEPPDNGARFARFYLSDQACRSGQALDLSHLQFAVLALGDRVYQEFCAFGHALHLGLCRYGAMALSEPLEVSAEDVHRDDGVLPRWYAQLRQLGGAESVPLASTAPVYQLWRLESRQVVNPGSPGAPLVHVKLVPPVGALLQWQAGDIVEIRPRNSQQRCTGIAAALSLDPDTPMRVTDTRSTLLAELQRRQLPGRDSDWQLAPAQTPEAWLASLPELVRREYSIASIPQDGSLDLLLRQQRDEQGELGLSSGWLTCHAAVGGDVELRVRSNPVFHAHPKGLPMILIGNGSGFAGLRAHLRARALNGDHENWLLFGERSPVYDRLFDTEISAWREAGQLQRVDLAFSRCPLRPVYVQDLLLAAAEELRSWLQRGALLYVCGSRKGMGEGVEKALAGLVGVDGLQQLKDSGRYRRDVY